MQTVLNSTSRLSDPQPGEKEHSRQLLYVTPSNSGQLQIAKYFWELHRPDNYHAMFATLENRPVNPWLQKCMTELGFQLDRNPQPSMFRISTIRKDFESIISIGGLENYCTLSPFLETLGVLFGTQSKKTYWHVPDPEYISGNQEEMYRGAIEIRDRIESEIAQLSRSLAQV